MIATIAIAAAMALTGFVLARTEEFGHSGPRTRAQLLSLAAQSALILAFGLGALWGDDGTTSAWALAGLVLGLVAGTVVAAARLSKSKSETAFGTS